MKIPENVRAYFQRQGKLGAKRRMEMLSPERRSEIAKKAAEARWARQAKSEGKETK